MCFLDVPPFFSTFFPRKQTKALCTFTCLKRTAPKGEPHSCVAGGTGGKDDPVGTRNDEARRGVVELTRRKRLNMARRWFLPRRPQPKNEMWRGETFWFPHNIVNQRKFINKNSIFWKRIWEIMGKHCVFERIVCRVLFFAVGWFFLQKVTIDCFG